MKKLLGPAVLFLLCSLPTFAQYEESRVELGGGFTFRSYGPPPNGGTAPNPHLDMFGWDATVSYDVNRWLTMATDFDGTYKSTADPEGGYDHTSIYSAVAGPRVYPLGHHRLAPFAHVMFGLAHATATASAATDCAPYCTLSDGSFALEAGAGLDLNATKHIAIRIGEFDYEKTNFLAFSFPPLSDTNNSYKYKAAVLLRF